MAGDTPQPRVTKNSQGKLLSYNLPHRAHSIKVYPIESPNGSTVILYGHENGVKIVWRGGRSFKSQQESAADPKKANGTSNAVVLLDSDDEGEKESFVDKPEFEDEEEDLDPSQPYPRILQELDLFFGVDVLHLAVLPSPIAKADGPSWRALETLKKTIVFAAACADNVVRLVTLPLTPPSPASKSRPEFRADFTSANAGHGKWGETVVILSGHQKPSDGVSISIDITSNAKEPCFVLASHSREVTGLLLLYRISIKSPKPHAEPFQSAYLSTPAKSISFNPSLSKQLSSQLLVAESTGVCRIYDYRLLKKSAEEPDTPSPERGTWLLSLHAGFQNIKPDSIYYGAHTGFGRKNIVDAQWVSGGHAIIILLSDGEWAIWDIEGVGPTASQGLLSRQGIQGASKSEYSLTGYIDATLKSKSSGPPQITSSKFVPMTPGTRKSVDLFASRGPGVFARGQLSVVEVPSNSSTSPVEESIFFWLGDTFAVIPSLTKYWAAHSSKASGGSLFAGTANRMVKLENIDLQGERCTGIAQIPKAFPAMSDVVVLGEHRYVLLDTGKQTKEDRTPKSSSKLVLTEKPANGTGMDLENGDLDVNGIEMALARMENRNGVKRKIF